MTVQLLRQELRGETKIWVKVLGFRATLPQWQIRSAHGEIAELDLGHTKMLVSQN